MRARMCGTSAQAVSEFNFSGFVVCAQIRPLAAATPAVIPILRKLRRVVIVLFVTLGIVGVDRECRPSVSIVEHPVEARVVHVES